MGHSYIPTKRRPRHGKYKYLKLSLIFKFIARFPVAEFSDHHHDNPAFSGCLSLRGEVRILER